MYSQVIDSRIALFLWLFPFRVFHVKLYAQCHLYSRVHLLFSSSVLCIIFWSFSQILKVNPIKYIICYHTSLFHTPSFSLSLSSLPLSPSHDSLFSLHLVLIPIVLSLSFTQLVVLILSLSSTTPDIGNSVNSYMWFACKESISSCMACNHSLLWASRLAS